MCPSKSQDSKEDPPRDDEGKMSNHNNRLINAVLKEDKLGKIILPSKSTMTYKPNKLTIVKIQLGSSKMLPTKQCLKAKMGNKTYYTKIV